MTTVARDIHEPYSRLYACVRGPRILQERPRTNLKLSRAEEAAVCVYVDMLDSLNLTGWSDHIYGAANFVST